MIYNGNVYFHNYSYSFARGAQKRTKKWKKKDQEGKL